MEPPGHKPLVVNVVVMGPFEEEEEGTGVASDVVKVQGEDPDTPGLILVAFITGKSSLEPLIEGLYAQIHVNLR